MTFHILYTGMVCFLYEFECVDLGYISMWILCYILHTGRGKHFYQYEFECEHLDWLSVRMIADMLYKYKVSHLCEYEYVYQGHVSVRMIFRRLNTGMVCVQYEHVNEQLSYVSFWMPRYRNNIHISFQKKSPCHHVHSWKIPKLKKNQLKEHTAYTISKYLEETIYKFITLYAAIMHKHLVRNNYIDIT